MKVLIDNFIVTKLTPNYPQEEYWYFLTLEYIFKKNPVLS